MSVVGVAFALAIATTAGAAHAQGAKAVTSDGAKEDLATLERSLAEQHDALSTADCTTACRALASILRAADKICALDPGERCAAGRAKADDAARRVRDACPDCALASGARAPEPRPRPEDRAMTKRAPKATSDEPQPAQESVATASAPRSESKRGGCAGCTTTNASNGDAAGGVLAALALAFALRRRRGRRHP